MALRLGTVTAVVASSPDAARDVLQRHDAAFSARAVPDGAHVFAHYTHSMGWLPATSPRWRALRKVCTAELFAPHRLDTHGSPGTTVCAKPDQHLSWDGVHLTQHAYRVMTDLLYHKGFASPAPVQFQRA
ncbi:hypothetical protein EJB05_52333, partial [Eragrostis curvula]